VIVQTTSDLSRRPASILAGDVGGTKTLIGLFSPHQRRPVPAAVRSFPTTEYPGLPEIIEAFYATLDRRPTVTSAAIGVAGPVINQTAKMTNVEWAVDGSELRQRFDIAHVRLLNDLEAMAYGLLVLDSHELRTLQRGTDRPEGNLALIAAGTGLGQSVLHQINGQYMPVASEGGHADFAARTNRELDLVRYLTKRYGRAEIEHVLSGPGLVNLADFTHQGRWCEPLRQVSDSPDAPAEISASALAGRCPQCEEALALFVEAFGASAGNLALTALTTGGVFIGGGIAPRILPALENGAFIRAFGAKGPMQGILEAMPVQVILNPEAGLLGAAAYANSMLQ